MCVYARCTTFTRFAWNLSRISGLSTAYTRVLYRVCINISAIADGTSIGRVLKITALARALQRYVTHTQHIYTHVYTHVCCMTSTWFASNFFEMSWPSTGDSRVSYRACVAAVSWIRWMPAMTSRFLLASDFASASASVPSVSISSSPVAAREGARASCSKLAVHDHLW